MRVDGEMLAERGACEKQVLRFMDEWPDGCEVTIENCRRAVELNLDVGVAVILFAPRALGHYRAERFRLWSQYAAGPVRDKEAQAAANAAYAGGHAHALYKALTAEQPIT